MSVLEIWGAEYQENDCLLIKPESRGLMEAICERERCFMQVCYFDVINVLHMCYFELCCVVL
jgi:phosphoribosylformylglycinamidine (FGAM) synthase-like enzyme